MWKCYGVWIWEKSQLNIRAELQTGRQKHTLDLGVFVGSADGEKKTEYLQPRFRPFSPDVTDPGPHGEQPADEQAERHRGLFEQLHDDAGLSTLGLPVRGLQRPVVVFVQEEQRLAAGHRLEHLDQRTAGSC